MTKYLITEQQEKTINEIVLIRESMRKLGAVIPEEKIDELDGATYKSAHDLGMNRGDAKGKSIATTALSQILGKYTTATFDLKITSSYEIKRVAIDVNATIINGFPAKDESIILVVKDIDSGRNGRPNTYWLRVWSTGKVALEDQDSKSNSPCHVSRATANVLANLFNTLHQAAGSNDTLQRQSIMQY